jgi:hypothetical protein
MPEAASFRRAQIESNSGKRTASGLIAGTGQALLVQKFKSETWVAVE